jgi:hypothetical protein
VFWVLPIQPPTSCFIPIATDKSDVPWSRTIHASFLGATHPRSRILRRVRPRSVLFSSSASSESIGISTPICHDTATEQWQTLMKEIMFMSKYWHFVGTWEMQYIHFIAPQPNFAVSLWEYTWIDKKIRSYPFFVHLISSYSLYFQSYNNDIDCITSIWISWHHACNHSITVNFDLTRSPLCSKERKCSLHLTVHSL